MHTVDTFYPLPSLLVLIIKRHRLSVPVECRLRLQVLVTVAASASRTVSDTKEVLNTHLLE